ncbi:GntR family transcriptional regulator [Enterococcus raffinosus]|uniref:GntR family transcriptional regulator n=1 Tax=Enterococcus raffinosus TaxID=71452 RepID=A0AAW8T6D3_9ENTE|nr:GntR family transcriptional regulator [Enterococcus raffinosus]MDT2523213.1 GntR family transcriptional regulator [Enterococcus raffinosus]MDT2531231.1 GntR family transcriptional regulator [Enterococcus raffinosus]MDT2533967.1 GntR family transcriptional regulator [Enterococcus raffinosus]MDT2544690.1 GntR family transcriptional regulator [Enterococcus raffinosus]MDT2555962.1 GntR family transcriptional regulator [Enterococcus raffinosus]
MNQSKYQTIADELKSRILSGEYKENTAIPPELQLQKDYQVSRHTIRQAIALLVNEGFLRKEKGSGTYVDIKYKQENKAPSNNHKTIGVVTTYLSDYIFPSIIRGIEKTLREKGYSLLLASTNNDFQQEKQCIEKMITQGVEGLIVEPTKSNQYNPNLALYVRLREQGIPMVMINAVYEEISAPFICVDDVESGFLATDYLIKNNHKKLLLVTKIDDLQGKYRMKGFIKACEKSGIQFSPEDIITFETETRKTIFDQVQARLKEEPQITGLVCYNDQVASSLIDRLSANGLQIPQELSVIGNDNSALSKIGNVKLTTLNHPREQMGQDSANWIIEAIEEGREPENILYEPTLIERDSVTPL